MMATGEEPPQIQEQPSIIETKIMLKQKVFESLTKNSSLYSDCEGVADIIIQCLHYYPNERSRHTEDILRLLDTYRYAADPDASTHPVTVNELATDVAKEVANFNQFIGQWRPVNGELFSRMIEIRLRQVLRTLKDIQGGNLVEITGTRDDIIDGFLNYLSVLRPGDRYTTWTQPKFWQPNNLGTNGRFLRMNELLARRYNVGIKRLFLISNEDYDLDWTLENA